MTWVRDMTKSDQKELEEEFSKVALQAAKTICFCYLTNSVNRESRWEGIFHLQLEARPASHQ